MQSHRVIFLSSFLHVPGLIEYGLGRKVLMRCTTNLYNLSMVSSNQFKVVNKHWVAPSGLIQNIALNYFRAAYSFLLRGVSCVVSLITTWQTLKKISGNVKR